MQGWYAKKYANKVQVGSQKYNISAIPTSFYSTVVLYVKDAEWDFAFMSSVLCLHNSWHPIPTSFTLVLFLFS